jgi:hypothetical protein
VRLATFRLVLFIAGPVVLFFTSPAALAAMPDLCVWKWILARECWGCGMTRAFVAILHGDIARAIEFNWRVIVAFPLIAFLAARSMWRDVKTLMVSARRDAQRASGTLSTPA